MISVKDAFNSVYQYLQSIQELLGDQLEDLRLEEVELSEDRQSWLITLGYDIPVKNRLENVLGSAFSTPAFRREYKLFRVNSETGEVEAMKIREI